MAPKRIQTRGLPRDDYHARWKKAVARRSAMERELAAGAHDPAVVLAIQAAIAACDALTLYANGERSASDRHQDAIAVLGRVMGIPGLDQAKTHLSRLLQEKAAIEYSGDPLRPADAERLVEHAKRFIAFVEKHLPE